MSTYSFVSSETMTPVPNILFLGLPTDWLRLDRLRTTDHRAWTARGLDVESRGLLSTPLLAIVDPSVVFAILLLSYTQPSAAST